jgi:hypothetical protein
MTDRTLLTVAATLELATGLALIASPSVVVHLLITTEVFGAGLFLGRLCGIALLSLTVACWPDTSRAATSSHVRSIQAMLLYNSLAAVFLAYLPIGLDLSGVCLWPAIIVHLGLALCFAQAAWKMRALSA